jgi:hypothetical protein
VEDLSNTHYSDNHVINIDERNLEQGSTEMQELDHP